MTNPTPANSGKTLHDLVRMAEAGDRSALECLVRMAKGGDRSAFGFLESMFGPTLLCLAQKIGCKGVEPNDLVQETFLAAWRHRDQCDGHFAGWLRKILINKCRNNIARARRFVSLEEGGSGSWGPSENGFMPQDRGPTASQKAAADEIMQALHAVVQMEKDEEQRNLVMQIVSLRVHESLPYRVIAERVGRDEKTVRIRLNRVVKRLANKLKRSYQQAAEVMNGTKK